MLASDAEEPDPEPLPPAPVELDPELVPPVASPDPPLVVPPDPLPPVAPSLMDSPPLDVDELVGAPPSGGSEKPRAAPLPHAATAAAAPKAADAPIARTKLISR
jgi:hypothetical protein